MLITMTIPKTLLFEVQDNVYHGKAGALLPMISQRYECSMFDP